MDAKMLVQRFKDKQKPCEEGSLCFWGNWFGRPYDNCHQIISMSFEEASNCLVVTFDKKEKLNVWCPEDIFMDELKLVIKSAKRVRWEWYSCGKPKIANNLYFEDLEPGLFGFKVKTNIDWYKPVYVHVKGSNAVELIKGLWADELPGGLIGGAK